MKTEKPAKILARHYIVAALWANGPEDSNPRPTRQAVDFAEKRAWEFLEIVGPDLLQTISPDYWQHPDCNGSIYAALGHDLWLTSQGHGVGFWDRDTLDEETREKLTRAADKFDRVYPEFYRGWLYFHGSGPLSLERVK